jgi:hypothetical protein
MLPVSSWPPGPPGSQLSPFGRPRTVNLARHCDGFVLPKGAWVVQTGANRVIMFRPEVTHFNPPRTPGTGILPGQIPNAKAAGPRAGEASRVEARCPPPTPPFVTHDAYLEAWRAWQRKTGRTDPPIRPLPGRVPPNFFGWRFDRCAPATVLVNANSGGTVLADGQNVVIAGAGCANITQAFSV